MSRASFIRWVFAVDKFALNFTTPQKFIARKTDAVKPSATKGYKRHKGFGLLCLLWLSDEADQWLVAGDAAEGEGDLVVAFDHDGVGEFDDDLGEGEVWDFAKVFYYQRVNAMSRCLQVGPGWMREIRWVEARFRWRRA